MNQQNSNPLEARTWLKSNKNPSALATNRFNDTKTALEFVEQLYQAGAVEVIVDNILDEEQRIQEEGGPSADSLIVSLPTDVQKRAKLFEIFNQESKHEGFENHEDDGQESVMLWWD